MLEQRIQQQFFESADLSYQAAEALGRPIAEAVAALVGGITAGGRIFVAGLGPAAALAQLMANALTGRFERDRPGLAAFALGTDAVALAALSADGSFDGVLARQVEALGQPGDLLLLIDHDGNHPALLADPDVAAVSVSRNPCRWPLIQVVMKTSLFASAASMSVV